MTPRQALMYIKKNHIDAFNDSKLFKNLLYDLLTDSSDKKQTIYLLCLTLPICKDGLDNSIESAVKVDNLRNNYALDAGLLSMAINTWSNFHKLTSNTPEVELEVKSSKLTPLSNLDVHDVNKPLLETNHYVINGVDVIVVVDDHISINGAIIDTQTCRICKQPHKVIVSKTKVDNNYPTEPTIIIQPYERDKIKLTHVNHPKTYEYYVIYNTDDIAEITSQLTKHHLNGV